MLCQLILLIEIKFYFFMTERLNFRFRNVLILIPRFLDPLLSLDLFKMVHKGKKKYLKTLNNEETSENVEEVKSSKKARIIVRNLPFKKLSEEYVKEFFQKYGDIEEVKLLRKDDGKFKGCGFVQFKKVSSAAKAIRHANEMEMSGRKIVIDWALPKKTFLDKVQAFTGNLDTNQIKEEVSSDNNRIEFEIDKKPDPWRSEGEGSENDEVKYSSGDDDNDNDSDDDTEDDNDDDDDYESDSSEKNNKSKILNGQQRKGDLSGGSHDVEDGKTVFIRNIPFSATNEDLKTCVENYGPVEYALICIDKLTEHSKGTGFVKFKDKESAIQCLKDSTNIYLHDNPLTITTALSKTNLESKKNSKKVVKDSRNLYLIREGLVIAGSKAAVGVSAGDMAKRLQLEQWKNQILKNLNMFVSKTRLVIHNLPPSYDDSKLRSLFMKYSNPKATIREAKVMYDKKKLDSSGNGVSKEVGFVSFTKHEDALEALRNINNNPNIFTPKKRPIVAFSIENKAVINTKLKRVEKSRAKLGISDENPDKFSKLNRKQRRFIKRREKFIERRKEAKRQKQQSEDGKDDANENTEKVEKRKREDGPPSKKRKINDSDQTTDGAPSHEFAGVMSESGKKTKLRSKFRLKNQANIHSQTLRNERRKRREKERRKMLVRKSTGQKKGKPKLMDDAILSNLIQKHRKSIQDSSAIKKWYDN